MGSTRLRGLARRAVQTRSPARTGGRRLGQEGAGRGRVCDGVILGEGRSPGGGGVSGREGPVVQVAAGAGFQEGFQETRPS